MAIDLIGINNENEFYTHHYLAAILEGDLKSLFETWAQMERPPWDGLRRLAGPFQAMRKELTATSDPDDRLALQRAWFHDLLTALGYSLTPDTVELEDGFMLSLAGQITRSDGRPELWVLEALNGGDEEDPLVSQEDLLTKKVFAATEPPRWVILYGGTQLLLLDRTKWPSKRLLRFDFEQILGRRESSTLHATAALLHRDSVCPPDQISLLDKLDENSHKHAFAVSEDLKYSAREAVELLGNEAVWYLREVLREGIYGKDLAERLTRECLRYLYRLLFLFYVEARSEELGYAPMKSEEYRTGYSLESLRDAAEAALSTEEDRNGFFLHHSLQTLFRLIFEGWHHELPPDRLGDCNFRMEPLRCDLFDPERTPLLSRVRLRNHVVQRVIELLSLSREGTGRRGRISYSQLGINQLGAVYEGLLSYTGFFVEEQDGLYEVKPEGEPPDPLKQAYFVPKTALPEYKEEENVFDDRGRLVHHPQGSFVYRLAGRNREKSASYYTPEVLTRCVVKYALKELLKEKSGDDILRLNICEPALGSGAFLNEAVNQLADAYLERKQRETGRVIGHDEYLLEKQKVKAYLANNRVYGVDRNPVAIELAEVSLWLNTIYERHTIPWFGGQLVAGNSLIGARRQAFTDKQLESQNREWLDSIPERVPMGKKRAAGQIWHFLVPDKGMAAYADKAVKEMLPAEMKRIREWRREFTRRFTSSDTKALERLSLAVDRLWKRHCQDLRQVRRDSEHIFPVFGQESNPEFAERGQRLTTSERDEIFQQVITPGGGQASAYQRLKLAMDYWCSLWFWPVDQSKLLPSRDEFLLELSALLEGTSHELSPLLGAEQQALFRTGKAEQKQLDLAEELGSVNLDELCEKLPRFKQVRELAVQHGFLHWELEFAQVFDEYGGFDLVLGNPPWIRILLQPQDVLAEYDPKVAIRSHTPKEIDVAVSATIRGNKPVAQAILRHSTDVEAERTFISSNHYPLASSTRTNLYKCFMEQGVNLARPSGIVGLLHDTGIYDEADAQRFRDWLLARLVFCARFINQLNHFPETALGHAGQFAVAIFRSAGGANVRFDCISSVLHPCVIDQSYQDSTGEKPIPPLKNESGWVLQGHRDRLITYDDTVLRIVNSVFGRKGRPLNAPILSVYARPLLAVLQKMVETQPLYSLIPDLKGRPLIDENSGVKTGLIVKQTVRPSNLSELILSAPHFYIGSPFFKEPNEACGSKGDYSNIDLIDIPNDFIPRAVFSLARPDSRTRICGHVEVERHIRDYRLAWRTWVSPTNERTLITAIIPPQVLHVYPTYSMPFPDLKKLVFFAGLTFTVLYDFFVRVAGVDHIWDDDIVRLPFPQSLNASFESLIMERVLKLCCITEHYAPLWNSCAPDHSSWKREFVFLTHKSRRNALIELDVLAAMALKLALPDLLLLYSTQFPTLLENEANTWYDTEGRIVFSTSRNLSGVGCNRKQWNEIKDTEAGWIELPAPEDKSVQGRLAERKDRYHAPFHCCDRMQDYATAWKFFEENGR